MTYLGKLLGAVGRRMTRTKPVDVEDRSTHLKRCLTLKRLTFIGVGNTVGVGIYVLIGVATKEMAGPSVIFSFLIAFLVSLLNGLCFAEFASKNSKTGAQYTYMYETIGEAMAFIVGWTSILGYIAAFSMGSRGWSGYVDSLMNHAIQNFTVSHIANWTSRGPPFPEYPDFPAIFIIIVVVVISSIGVNFSTTINAIIAGISGVLLIFITICGLFFGNTNNWFNVKGGFFPYGLKGVIKASSACYYAFQGYDVLGFSAEETVNPKKTIPRSIVLVLVIVTCLYLGVAISFTLMVPYTEVNTNAPFPGAFQYNSVTWAKYIVAIGPLLALLNLCMLVMYAVSRLVYSMSSDGLLFKFLSKVNKHTKVPLGPILAFGPIVTILVLTIDLSNLIGFMVIYSFIQYSLFAAYLIVLRYESTDQISGRTSSAIPLQKEEIELIPDAANHYSDNQTDEKDGLTLNKMAGNDDADFIQRSDSQKSLSTISRPDSHQSYRRCAHGCMVETFTVKRLVLIIYLSSFLLAVQLVCGSDDVMAGKTLGVFCVTMLSILIIISTVMIWKREQKGDEKGFLVPLMPFFPVCSLFFNLVLLISAMDTGSFIASSVMALIGAVIYLLIVIYEVVKKPDEVIACDVTDKEKIGLLSDAAEDDRYSEEEIVIVKGQVQIEQN